MKWIKRSYLSLILVIMYAPIAILMIFSFNDSKLPIWEGFTLSWYENMFSNGSIQSALGYTITIAVLAALLATIIGTLAAIGIYSMKGWKKKLAINVTYIPMLSPDIVIGISLMMLFKVLHVPFGIPSLVIAHTTFCIPYVIFAVMPKLKQMDYNLYEAALDLGASPIYAFRHVILPEIMPGVLAGTFIAFTLSIDDFVVSFFNKGAGGDTLPIKIYSMARKGVNPTINAISTLMFVTIIIILLVSNLKPSGKPKKSTASGVSEQSTLPKKGRYKKLGKRLVSAVLIIGLGLGILGYSNNKSNKVVYVYNWGDYIDPEVNDLFTEETGIKVVYQEYPDNEVLYTSLDSDTVEYDVVFPSDYMIEKLINHDKLQKIDTSKIPNYANIDSQFKNLPYDPNNEYSVPYMWGTVGIVYNKKMVDDVVDSWDILWNEKYKDKIFMYDSERDSIMVALKKLGYSMNTRNQAELEAAKEALIEQAPLVLGYVGDEGKAKMANNEAALMVAYAGDAMAMMAENPDLAFAIPKEGSNYFVDGICITKNAKNVEAAYEYINFLCRPEISARNAEYIGYSTPISAAKEFLPDDIKNSEVAYPDESVTKGEKMEMFKDPSDVASVYSSIWTQVKASN